MELFVTKESTNKKGETKQIQYRVDADFIPTAIGQIAPEFIENYCVANEETDWLCEIINKTKPNKHGITVNYSFIDIRKEFVLKFFPTIIKGENKPTPWRKVMLAKYEKAVEEEAPAE